MGLRGLLIAGTLLIYFAVVFAMIAGPIFGPLYEQTHSDAVEKQSLGDQHDFVRDIGLKHVMTMFLIGIILYGYAALQRSESFFGSGPRGPR